jgi:hypothetical protein
MTELSGVRSLHHQLADVGLSLADAREMVELVLEEK